MKASWAKILWVVPVLVGIAGMTLGTALAHEEREVWEYNLNIGWIDEPAYEGFMNGVELRVIRTSEQAASEESGDHHDGDDGDSDEGMTSRGDGDGTPVTGLEETMQVEVTHVASGASVILDLYPDRFEPGRYTADLIPTVPGVYEFRVFGFIEEELVDQTFASAGGGGDFDDIRQSAGLQFPEQVASPRELESAVRGALSAAQQAQDAALAASEDDDDGASAVMVIAIVALVLGGLGLATGAGGVWLALRRR